MAKNRKNRKNKAQQNEFKIHEDTPPSAESIENDVVAEEELDIDESLAHVNTATTDNDANAMSPADEPTTPGSSPTLGAEAEAEKSCSKRAMVEDGVEDDVQDAAQVTTASREIASETTSESPEAAESILESLEVQTEATQQCDSADTSEGLDVEQDVHTLMDDAFKHNSAQDEGDTNTTQSPGSVTEHEIIEAQPKDEAQPSIDADLTPAEQFGVEGAELAESVDTDSEQRIEEYEQATEESPQDEEALQQPVDPESSPDELRQSINDPQLITSQFQPTVEEDYSEAEGEYSNVEGHIEQSNDPTHDGHDAVAIQHDEHTEALIQAAARDVIARLEEERKMKESQLSHPEAEDLSPDLDEKLDEASAKVSPDHKETNRESVGWNSEATEMTYEPETDYSYSESGHDGHEERYEESPTESDREEFLTHHDADIDEDDVFSDHPESTRLSLNSNGTVEIHRDDLTVSDGDFSRIPSSNSFSSSHPQMHSPYTPTAKAMSRPPFRTPSSVRALQMSSPVPSVFSSPRSTRLGKSGSRLATPTSQRLSISSRKSRTPTCFVKREDPLVLLHVTVLPVHWVYADLLESADSLPPQLMFLRESWRLLLDKVGDTVMERGVLLPHPQDDYEVLEERLLAALELPVRPRALILKCGHYLRGSTPDPFSSSSETDSCDDDSGFGSRSQSPRKTRKAEWCDICRREVKLDNAEYMLGRAERRFNVKVFASNGLMSSGAWSAAWKEMERVDVEIEPLVKSSHMMLLEDLAEEHLRREEHFQQLEEEHLEDHGVAEEPHMEAPADDAPHDLPSEADTKPEDEDAARRMLEEERMREVYGVDHPKVRAMTPRPTSAESFRDAHTTSPVTRPRTLSRATNTPPPPPIADDSLGELLLKAFKVVMRDQKNVLIGVLCVLVVLLALRPSQPAQMPSQDIVNMGTDSVKIVGASEGSVSGRAEAQMPAAMPEVKFEPATPQNRRVNSRPEHITRQKMTPKKQSPKRSSPGRATPQLAPKSPKQRNMPPVDWVSANPVDIDDGEDFSEWRASPAAANDDDFADHFEMEQPGYSGSFVDRMTPRGYPSEEYFEVDGMDD